MASSGIGLGLGRRARTRYALSAPARRRGAAAAPALRPQPPTPSHPARRPRLTVRARSDGACGGGHRTTRPARSESPGRTAEPAAAAAARRSPPPALRLGSASAGGHLSGLRLAVPQCPGRAASGPPRRQRDWHWPPGMTLDVTCDSDRRNRDRDNPYGSTRTCYWRSS